MRPGRRSCSRAPALVIGSPQARSRRSLPPKTKSSPRPVRGGRRLLCSRGAGRWPERPLTPCRRSGAARSQAAALGAALARHGRAMKVEFAPLNIPLARRLQTAAVLQWLLSFLLLGKDAWPRKIQAKPRGAWGSACSFPDRRGRKVQGRP